MADNKNDNNDIVQQRQGRKRKQQFEPPLEDYGCVITKHTEKPCKSQPTSDIQFEAEPLETISVYFEMSALSTQEDEPNLIIRQESELNQETYTLPSECVIPELFMIKQEPRENFHQECETNNETDLNSMAQNDCEIPESCTIKHELHENFHQESESTQETDFNCATRSDWVIPEFCMIKQEPHESETCPEFTPPNELCDTKQESLHHTESYPDFTPPEIIFLPTTNESEPPSTENDNLQSISVQRLSQRKSEKMTIETCKNVPQVVREKIPKIWKCEFCTQYFGTKSRLSVHMGIKHSGAKNLRQFQVFYDHLRKYHVKTFEFRDKMLTYSLLIEMANTDHSFPCLECGVVFADKHSLCSHLNSEHKSRQSKGLVRCKLCFKCHNDFSRMELHLQQDHTRYWNHCIAEDILYCCTKCEELFAKCNLYQNSDGRNLEIKDIKIFRKYCDGGFQFKYKIIGTFKCVTTNYSCTVCKPTTFFTTEKVVHKLFTHLEAHDDTVFKKCSVSNHSFVNINQLYQHDSLKCCKSEIMNFDNHVVSRYQISKCNFCALEFVNSCSLAMHVPAVHQGIKFNVKLMDGKLTCPFCKVIFSDHKLFYAHCSPYTILFSNSSRHCEKCSVLFSTSSEFKQHCITKHNKHNCFKCQICNFGKESKAQLETHVMKEHNVQLIHCTNCLSNVKIKDKLTMEHFKKCYKSSELWYSCPVCGLLLDSFKSFIDHINFDILMLQTKVYQCKHCLNYFFSKYNLCAHVVNGKCQLCQLYFCGKAKLAEHTASQQCVPVKSADVESFKKK